MVPAAPEGLAAVPVGGGGAWPGFATSRQPGATGVEGTGGHGRASTHGAERREVA